MFGGPPGDLYVVIRVTSDEIFERQGQNLIISREISMVEAALGHRMEVPTLDDPVNLDIPSGTQAERFSSSWAGMPHLGARIMVISWWKSRSRLRLGLMLARKSC